MIMITTQSVAPRQAHRLSKIVAGIGIALSSIVFFNGMVSADVLDREQAKFLHDRLTGTLPTDAMLDLMESSIADDNDPETAARYAIDGNSAQGDDYGDVITPSGGFYNAVVKNWASPWTNESMDVFAPLNDYSATVIGLVRDAADFRSVLYGDVIYTGALPTYSNTDNDHYEALEALSEPLGDSDVLVFAPQSSMTGINSEGVAGVMTTRAAARAFFVDGTNRAMFRFTVLNHLCDDLEQYKDTALPTDRIRQDVSRSPGGDSSIFLNECAGCHTGMDGMAQAFAYHQFDYPTEEEQPSLTETERMDMGQMIYTSGEVQPKHLINSGNFRDGFIITDDHWVNYWRSGPNTGKIGWSDDYNSETDTNVVLDGTYSEGDGAASLGQELANTEAFAFCQVKKAFESVCLREPQEDTEQAEFESIVSDFQSNNYDMKQAFIDVAVHCSAHINP